jgi:hypothetical protein
MEFRDIFTFGLPISLLILLRNKKDNPFFLYIAVGFAAEFVGLLYKDVLNHEVMLLSWTIVTGVYTIFESATYYSYLIERNSSFKNIYKLAFLISIAWSVFLVSIYDPFLYSFWPFSITSLILMFMGLLGYSEMLSAPEVSNPLKSSFFWINSAFFMFGAGSTIIFLFIDSGLREEFNVMANLWIVGYGVVSGLRYLFIGIGVYQKDMIT